MGTLCSVNCGFCGRCSADWEDEDDSPFPAEDDPIADELLGELFGTLSDEEIEALADARHAGF